jgi:regulatory protein|tara:strand:- start:147 stop:599 length:453 start_codon:yes stop_codon:yes gene_type:complete
MSDDLFNLIYNKSLDLLSRREHSRKELKDKLLLRFDSIELIQTVLDKLETNNLINELRFAEAYARSRKRKGFGPKKIFYELSTKGITESISDQVILEEGNWEKVAKAAFIKKFKNGPSEEIKQKLKQKNFLQNRGFGFKEIESVFTDDML